MPAVPRVGIRREQDAFLFRRGLQDLGVGCGQQPDVRDVDRIVLYLFEESRDLGRKVRVEEQLHAAGATTASSRSCAAAAAYSSAARTSSRSR
jgi:hypothetical protein